MVILKAAIFRGNSNSNSNSNNCLGAPKPTTNNNKNSKKKKQQGASGKVAFVLRAICELERISGFVPWPFVNGRLNILFNMQR